MDLKFSLIILYFKFSKKHLLHKILKISELVNNSKHVQVSFTFKLDNANYKLEALSIWWDILILKIIVS